MVFFLGDAIVTLYEETLNSFEISFFKGSEIQRGTDKRCKYIILKINNKR